MTQKELIIKYIQEHGSILPAKLGGELYLGIMFGSETTKRCRELRAKNVLHSRPEGKFERFYFTDWYQEANKPRVYRPATAEELERMKQSSLFK